MTTTSSGTTSSLLSGSDSMPSGVWTHRGASKDNILVVSADQIAVGTTRKRELQIACDQLAAGLPVVNTSLATTVPFVARHDMEALTVAPGDAKALAEALNQILDQPALAHRLGAAGQARALSEFDQSVFRARMAAVYADVVRTRRERATMPR